MGGMEGMTMADLMGAPDQQPKKDQRNQPRSVDDFDFDEEAFLAALDTSNNHAPMATGIDGNVPVDKPALDQDLKRVKQQALLRPCGRCRGR